MLRISDTARPTRRAALLRALGFACAGRPLVAAAAEPASSPILTRPIPHSGEELPVVGLGTAVKFDVGDGRGDDPAKRAMLGEVLRVLVAGGGKLVDTASSYGNAETLLGALIAENGLRPKIFLASKLEAGEMARGQSALDEALRRLRTDRIDLMMLHNVSRPEQNLAPMRPWQAAGTVRYLGISTSFTRDFDAVEAVMRREKPDFLEINYSLGDSAAEQRLLPAAAELGVAVLIDLPFGRGRLFRAVRDKALPEWAPNSTRQAGRSSFSNFCSATRPSPR
ncbi:MAG: aldo/keto reductase [Alphaproteobacteria bacterium]|nr:aldo/keto reductase [Alphaproteobacteria bacterium]